MSKKYIFLLGFIILIITVGLLFFNKKPVSLSNEQIVAAITPVPLPARFDTGSDRVGFVYNGPGLDFPQTLPDYVASYPPNLLTITQNLAKQLGINEQYINPVPYVYDWGNGVRHFSYNENSLNITYAQLSAPASDTDALQLTDLINLIKQNNIVSSPFALLEYNQHSSESFEGEGEQNATIINYETKLPGAPYPFIFNGLSMTSGEIRVNVKNNVEAFSFFITPQIQATKPNPILNQDQILLALNAQKGYLANTSAGLDSYGSSGNLNFTSVTLSTIELAYLYLSDEEKFIPVYVCDGQTSLNDLPTQVRYILPATQQHID